MSGSVARQRDEIRKFSDGSNALFGPSLIFLVLIVALLAASGVHAQASPGGGQATTPDSGIEKPGDSEVRAPTNIEIFHPYQGIAGGQAVLGGVSRNPVRERTDGSARPQSSRRDLPFQ